MKRLGGRVNIIPVVAKADTMTADELQRFKQRIMEDIKKFNLRVYQFAREGEEDDESYEDNRRYQKLMPFAVVSSNDSTELNGGRVRIRQFPWGRVEVDNPAHCDVLALESVLFKYVLLHVANCLVITSRSSRMSPATTSTSSTVLQNCRNLAILSHSLPRTYRLFHANKPSASAVSRAQADDETRAREERIRREEEAIRKAKEELAAKERELRSLAAKLSIANLDQ